MLSDMPSLHSLILAPQSKVGGTSPPYLHTYMQLLIQGPAWLLPPPSSHTPPGLQFLDFFLILLFLLSFQTLVWKKNLQGITPAVFLCSYNYDATFFICTAASYSCSKDGKRNLYFPIILWSLIPLSNLCSWVFYSKDHRFS